MVLKSGKEVYNKVSENESNKEERLRTMESDLQIEKENNPSPSPAMSNLTMTYKSRVPYPQAFFLDAPFPSMKNKQRDDILETFIQVKVNLPLLEAIR